MTTEGIEAVFLTVRDPDGRLCSLQAPAKP
jgi:hypothetical protein